MQVTNGSLYETKYIQHQVMSNCMVTERNNALIVVTLRKFEPLIEDQIDSLIGR